ncbi:MAG: dockerin type I repeat-containing protein [Oscillospiraceae bacterium]|nr:dockerin type I repeat-containing protein [Oscillospiraceae bacterium]
MKDGVTYSFDLDYDTNESSSSGRITLPYTDFVVDYETGDDITIIGTDSVINAACSGVTTLDVSMEEDQVTVTGVDNVETSFKISSVYSSDEYTSVELDGILDSGDSVTVRLTDDRLTIDSSINGSNSLEVTSSNDSSPEFQVISVLDASAPAAEFEDVRDAEAYVPNDESNASTPGDLNGDGEVNASDLTILARHVGKVETMEDETYLANADVTGDGNVDASDLTKLAQYVGKIISSLD